MCQTEIVKQNDEIQKTKCMLKLWRNPVKNHYFQNKIQFSLMYQYVSQWLWGTDLYFYNIFFGMPYLKIDKILDIMGWNSILLDDRTSPYYVDY